MQPANPPPAASGRRLAAFEGIVLVLLLALTALRLLVAARAPLSADEAYYWQWTRPLQLSYFDHPAMVAYWIKLGILALGDTPLGVRMPAALAALATSLFVWDATRTAFSSRLAGATAALWLNSTLSFGAAAVIITPDSPLLLAWSAALWAAIRLIAGGGPGYLYALALALGLGAISKYTMALILPGLAATFLAFRALWPWWKSRHGWRALLLAAFCTLPLFFWNFQHDWASFAKQLGHAFATTPPNPWKNLLDFLGSQVGLVTPLIFVFALWGMGWALYAGWRQNRPQWFLLGATSAPVLLFFLHHTQSGVVQAHWAGPAYLGAIMATAGWLGRHRLSGLPARLGRTAPLLGAAITGLVYLQAATAMLPLPVRIDALKRLGGWDELAAAVAEERAAHPEAFIFTQNHEPTGPLAFHLPDHPPVFLEGPIRPSYYSAADVAALRGRDGLFVTRAKDDGSGDLGPYFGDVEPLRTVVMHWGDREAERYRIYLAKAYRGGLFVVGDGFNAEHDAALEKPVPASPAPAEPDRDAPADPVKE